MEDLSFVAEVQASQELEEKELHIVWVKGTRVVLHVATEICILGGTRRGRKRGKEESSEEKRRNFKKGKREGEREGRRERERGREGGREGWREREREREQNFNLPHPI